MGGWAKRGKRSGISEMGIALRGENKISKLEIIKNWKSGKGWKLTNPIFRNFGNCCPTQFYQKNDPPDKSSKTLKTHKIITKHRNPTSPAPTTQKAYKACRNSLPTPTRPLASTSSSASKHCNTLSRSSP